MGQNTEMGIFSTILFGIVFGLGWTPCIGAFLGSALMLASSQASWTQGILLLLCYSAGLGIPFLISAVLIQKLKTTFDWIKKSLRDHKQDFRRTSDPGGDPDDDRTDESISGLVS